LEAIYGIDFRARYGCYRPRVSGRSEELEVKIDLSNQNRFAYKNLLLWLLGGVIVGFFFDELLHRLSDRTQVIILVVAVVVIWYRIDFPKKTTNSGATLLFWLPLALGLFCGVMWKISGEDLWVRMGIACICVRAVTEFIRCLRSSESSEGQTELQTS